MSRPELDRLSATEIVDLLLDGELRVGPAVRAARDSIAAAADLVADRIGRGGRAAFVGAGTSGRIAVAEAAELPGTFGLDRSLVPARVAGGPESTDHDEDDPLWVRQDSAQLALTDADVLVAVAASGTTPYTVGMAAAARAAGVPVIAVVTVPGSDLTRLADIAIEIDVGPEVLRGSTRLSAGTAQKIALNALTTAAMARTGRVHGDLMIDVVPANAKLQARSAGIVADIAGCDTAIAQAALAACCGNARAAVLHITLGLAPEDARVRAAEHSTLRAALHMTTGSLPGSREGATMELINARVVTPDGILDRGRVVVDEGRIGYVGADARPTGAGDVIDLGGRWLLPGFIDLHVHGGGGADVTKGPEDMSAAIAYHRGRGTTRTLVSLMAQPVAAMSQQLGWAAELAQQGVIAGAHLEGPFLSAARSGAQRPESLLIPDLPVLQKLLDAGHGCVRTVTIAPELPGALDVIAELVRLGVVAAIGHTNARYEEAAAGFAAGATLATHLFNAMGSFTQRAPGPAVAALDADVYVEMINDGVHVHDALIRLVGRSHPRKLCLITDAISATGVGDGEYTLGEQSVVVRNGAVHLAASDGSPRLAGSTLTMDTAVRRAVQVLGLPIEAASAAASGNPARALGLADTGAIATGLDADLVVLDDALNVQRVMCVGAWVA